MRLASAIKMGSARELIISVQLARILVSIQERGDSLQEKKSSFSKNTLIKENTSSGGLQT